MYGASLRHIAAYTGEDWTDRDQPLIHHFLAGCITGAVQTPLVTVCDYAKVQVQIQTRSAKKGVPSGGAQAGERKLYRNSVHCAMSVARNHGVSTLFRGTGTTLVRDITYGQYFATYEWLKRIFTSWSGESESKMNPVGSAASLRAHRQSRALTPALPTRTDAPHPRSPPCAASAFAGGLSGLMGWVLIYPVDAVKTRLQARTSPPLRTKTTQPQRLLRGPSEARWRSVLRYSGQQQNAAASLPAGKKAGREKLTRTRTC